MGNLILVTGGARSGKSSFAEETAKAYGDRVLYVATSIPFDEEMKLRVKKHREQRPAVWETLEAYKEFDLCLPDKLYHKSAVLIDCITIMVTNLMFEKCADFDNFSSDDVVLMEVYINNEIQKLTGIIKASNVPFIIVTNEVGMGIVPEHASTRLFRDIAGRVNQTLAKVAKEVYLCVSGISVKIK